MKMDSATEIAMPWVGAQPVRVGRPVVNVRILLRDMRPNLRIRSSKEPAFYACYTAYVNTYDYVFCPGWH